MEVATLRRAHQQETLERFRAAEQPQSDDRLKQAMLAAEPVIAAILEQDATVALEQSQTGPGE